MKTNLFHRQIENLISKQELPTDIKEISQIPSSIKKNIFNILSSGKEFKKYKVVINGKKGKVISNTPQEGLYVKFDNSGKIKKYSSIDEIETFKILKEEKQKKQ